ncbi:MAG TPA: LysM peptidoglycan-binding domain-containing protein, partial [Polyangia bacterium]|nr:LysM peptidoglycan-binding domain-containing protein [Polyangia bacterium]
MSTIFKSIPWAAILAVTFASAAAAEDDAGYQPDLRPGVNLRSEESAGGSLLSRAARDRVSVVIGGEGARAVGEDVKTYVVRSGDTLWDICTRFFGDPYDWPRVWSYNTRITNPNWIYPGDLLWLVPPEQGPAVAPASAPATPQAATTVKRRPQTVLVRNRGFVDAEILKQAGTIVGSHGEVMMLSQYD